MATAPAQNNKRKRTNDKPIARGGKRTKEDLEAAQHDPAQQESSLKAYMFHANKLLHKACKKAKTFELQKLTRKIKSTREPKGEGQKPVDQSVLSDLEAQLVCLKALSIDPIPPHLLRSRIPKLACVREIEFVPSIVSAIPSTPASKWTELDGQSAEAKARNRVLANKAVTDAWDEVVRAIKKRLGQPVEPAQPAPLKTTDKGKSKESTTTTRTNEEGGGGGGEKRLSKRAERAKRAEETKKNLPKRSMEMSAERKALLERALGGDAGERGNEGDTEEEEDDSDDQGPIPGSGDEGEFDDDEIERELAAMNGELSGSEGDWGSDSDDDDDNLGGGGGRGGEASESDSSARPTKRSRVAALSPSPRPVPSSARKAAATKPVTSSAFLPSLAAGYVSYSDSDGEDAKWVKAAERETKKGERKNRRGQRARQAIWEKKYGSAAAHVVKAQGGKPLPVDKLKQNKKAIRAGAESVPKSLKPKKGDAAAAGTSKPEAQQAQEPFNPANAPGGSANPNAQPVAPRQRGYGAATATPGSGTAAGGEKMHPSWEAKRKQAEALKSTQPQGKKITFD